MKFILKLKEIKQETPDVQSFIFSLENKDQPFSYQAGQYLKWFLPHDSADNRGISRYFTISSAPSEHQIMLTTRFNHEHSSSFKTELQNLNVGSQIEVEEPRGSFTYQSPEDKEKETIFIAGGIGITPFHAVLKELASQSSMDHIRLLYANKSEGDVPFKEELDTLTQRLPNLKVDYIYGHLTKESLDEYSLNSERINLTYISGPEAMVEKVTDDLVSLGISKEKIKQDFFPGYQEF